MSLDTFLLGANHIIIPRVFDMTDIFLDNFGALVAQWVKPWPTDLADRVQTPLKAKSSQP